MVDPVLVLEVPLHGLLQTFLELKAGLPTELAVQLRRVDGIAQVMSSTVGDEGDELFGVTFGVAQEAVGDLHQQVDEVDVAPLIEAPDVVGVGGLPLVED